MPAYLIKANIVSIEGNGSRKLARKSNGDLWCCYVRSDGTQKQIYCSYSTDGGLTWTEEQVSEATGGNGQEMPSIAIDSEDNVHVVWDGTGVGTNPTYNNIQYRKRTTSWQTKVNITDGSQTYYQYTPAIAVDSSNYLHLVWSSNGGYSTSAYFHIVYCKYTTSWQAVENVTSGTTSNYEPSIAADSSDNIHVVWRRGAYAQSGQGIYYRKRTSSWQTEELVQGSTQAVLTPCIALDASDSVHVVYYYFNGVALRDIRYRKRTTSWQAEETVYSVAGESHIDPTIAINTDGSIHVVWIDNTHYNIMYAKREVPWPTPTTVVAGTHPNLIWANYPIILGRKTNIPKSGYAFVFTTASPDAKFWGSADLSWFTRWQGNINVDQLIYQHAERMR